MLGGGHTRSGARRRLANLGLLLSAIAGCAVHTPPGPPGRTLAGSGVIDRRAEFAADFAVVRSRWNVPDESTDDRPTLHLDGAVATGTPTAPVDAPTPHDIAILFAWGFMGDAADPPYRHAISALRTRGYEIGFLDTAGAASTTYNAHRIARAVAARPPNTGKRLVLVGHSKGVTDILHFLVDYPGLALDVAAVVAIAGAVHGSPLAEDVPWMPDVVTFVPVMAGVRLGDARALPSIRRTRQGPWMATHRLPTHVRYYTIGAATDRAHVSWVLRPYYDALAAVDPVADGLVPLANQLIPGSTLLAIANADHVAVVYAPADLPWIARPLHTQLAFPRSAMFEAAVEFVRSDFGRPR